MNVTASKRRKPESDKENDVVITTTFSEGDISPAIGCFDLKMRNNGSEPHHSSAATKLAKLLNLFRSKSDPTAKPASPTKSHSKSPKHRSVSSSPTGAVAVPRRRFVRVVRDAEARAPEMIDDNPHVICRYSQSFLEEHYRKSQDELLNRPLPYVTSGHTILKKSQTDPTPSCEQHSPTAGKHATFKEFVEVIEFSGHDVVETGPHVTREARLHDYDVLSSDHREPGFFLRHDSMSSETENVDDEDAEVEDSTLQDEVKEVAGKVTGVDLDRMDGVMRNIFSSVANVVQEASPEPPKIRRVELSELITHCGEVEEMNETVSSGSKS